MIDSLCRYGKCEKCQSAIEIPGLEAYLCNRCGWVPRTKIRTPKVTEVNPVTVISLMAKTDIPKATKPDVVNADVVKAEQTLLDLTL